MKYIKLECVDGPAVVELSGISRVHIYNPRTTTICQDKDLRPAVMVFAGNSTYELRSSDMHEANATLARIHREMESAAEAGAGRSDSDMADRLLLAAMPQLLTECSAGQMEAVTLETYKSITKVLRARAKWQGEHDYALEDAQKKIAELEEQVAALKKSSE